LTTLTVYKREDDSDYRLNLPTRQRGRDIDHQELVAAVDVRPELIAQLQGGAVGDDQSRRVEAVGPVRVRTGVAIRSA